MNTGMNLLGGIMALILMGLGISFMIGGHGSANRFARFLFRNGKNILFAIMGYFFQAVGYVFSFIGRELQSFGNRLNRRAH